MEFLVRLILSFILRATLNTLSVFSRAFVVLLPSLLVLIALYRPQLPSFTTGINVADAPAVSNQVIHELFPNATWNDLDPCGVHFNEQTEFNRALSCVNEKVWPNTPLIEPERTTIPRCFVVKANASDVFNAPRVGFNFLPIFFFDIMSGIELGAVVGVYQPETRTVFIVENVDAAMVYRHELQHYFLHLHDPWTGGAGHDQEIWSKCEPPFYTPSDRVRPAEAQSEKSKT